MTQPAPPPPSRPADSPPEDEENFLGAVALGSMAFVALLSIVFGVLAMRHDMDVHWNVLGPAPPDDYTYGPAAVLVFVLYAASWAVTILAVRRHCPSARAACVLGLAGLVPMYHAGFQAVGWL